MKKNNKGFTLVELIVVLVILAILAAILVPALLGYIDKARNSQYEEEAHSILTAVQANATEQYAKGASAASDLHEIRAFYKLHSFCRDADPLRPVNGACASSHPPYDE